MPGEGEQVERGERHGQIALAMPEVVFELVAVVFQDVEAFVLDLPPCAAADGDLGGVALVTGSEVTKAVLYVTRPWR